MVEFCHFSSIIPLPPKRGNTKHKHRPHLVKGNNLREEMVPLEDEEKGPTIYRPALKTLASFNNYPSWKNKLRENCFIRVREDRNRLLWKLRLPEAKEQFPDNKDGIKSTFQDIVSDELRKIKGSSLDECPECTTFGTVTDDMIWEYDGLHTSYQGDCEEILLEMQKIFYEDLRTEETTKDSKSYVKTWEDEGDEYLARAVYEHMQLSSEKVIKEVCCPICKQGKLQERVHISCNQCQLRLDRDDEVNLDFLQHRIGEAHAEHLERGRRLKPKHCMETKFDFNSFVH